MSTVASSGIAGSKASPSRERSTRSNDHTASGGVAASTLTLPSAGEYLYWFSEKGKQQYLDNPDVTLTEGRRPWKATFRGSDADRRHLQWGHDGGYADQPEDGFFLTRANDGLLGVYLPSNLYGPAPTQWSPQPVLVPPLRAGAERSGTSEGHITIHGSNLDGVLTWTVKTVAPRTVRFRGKDWSAWLLHRTWRQDTATRGECTMECKGTVNAAADEVYVPGLGLVVDISGHIEHQGDTFSQTSDFHLALDGIELS